MSKVLPNADRAFVDLAKLRDYCLNPLHEVGKDKARVFKAALGFTADDAEKLRGLLLEAVRTTEALLVPRTAYGQRYVVDIEAPGLKGNVIIRSSWIVRDGEDFPRLTSCYIK